MPVAYRFFMLVILVGTCFAGDGLAQECCNNTRTRTRTVTRTHCHGCRRAVAQCRCAQPMLVQPTIAQPICPIIQPAPVMVPQTTMEPVYETKYRPQTCVTNRTVVETQYRTEAFAETVPVQTMRNVTVDEGQWQQVWVARPVVKQVAETTYQQRMNCRTVPQQVTRVVPQVSTTMVPYQSVRYVARQTCVPTMGTTMNSIPSLSSYPFPATATAFNSPVNNLSPYAYQPTPAFNTAASSPNSAYDISPSSSSPVPDARYLEVPNSSNYSGSNSDYVPPQAVPRRQPTSYADDIAPRVSSASGRFSGVPSAAAVWRATSVR